jgi:hypothetical protein
MTVFDAQSELATKNLRSTILTRLAEMKHDLKPGEEPILKENNRRFCLFPVKYHEVRFIYYYGLVKVCVIKLCIPLVFLIDLGVL